MWDNGSVYLQFRVHVGVKLMALAQLGKASASELQAFLASVRVCFTPITASQGRDFQMSHCCDKSF